MLAHEKPQNRAAGRGKGPLQNDVDEAIVVAGVPHTIPLGPQEEGGRVGGETAPACKVLEDEHVREEVVDEPVREKAVVDEGLVEVEEGDVHQDLVPAAT